jgi:hypothetical protein
MLCWDKHAQMRPDFNVLRLTLSLWLQREWQDGRAPGSIVQPLKDATPTMA